MSVHSARSSVISGLSASDHEHHDHDDGDGSGDETDDHGTRVSGTMSQSGVTFNEDDMSVSRPGTALTTTTK